MSLWGEKTNQTMKCSVAAPSASQGKVSNLSAGLSGSIKRTRGGEDRVSVAKMPPWSWSPKPFRGSPLRITSVVSVWTICPPGPTVLEASDTERMREAEGQGSHGQYNSLGPDLGLVMVGTVTKDEGGTDSAEMSGSTPANHWQQGWQGKHACPLQPSLAQDCSYVSSCAPSSSASSSAWWCGGSWGGSCEVACWSSGTGIPARSWWETRSWRPPELGTHRAC